MSPKHTLVSTNSQFKLWFGPLHRISWIRFAIQSFFRQESFCIVHVTFCCCARLISKADHLQFQMHSQKCILYSLFLTAAPAGGSGPLFLWNLCHALSWYMGSSFQRPDDFTLKRFYQINMRAKVVRNFFLQPQLWMLISQVIWHTQHNFMGFQKHFQGKEIVETFSLGTFPVSFVLLISTSELP